MISPHKWSGKREPEVTLDIIREIVDQAIQKALHPESEEPQYPLITKSHIGIEVQFVDFGGQRYRGVLYPSKDE
jgi:hypothetical protein